jgi:Heparinase II/III-like protein
MRRWSLAAALAAALCAAGSAGVAEHTRDGTVFEPAIMEDSFSGDGLGQWASYPPAQDVGYEPSLTPTHGFDAPGGRALMRVVRPPAPGPIRIGFIKRLTLVMSEDGNLVFRCRLQPDLHAPATIELGLAGGDGHRYTLSQSLTPGTWTTIGSKLSDFHDDRGKPPHSGTPQEALFIVATIPHASPDITYRLLIDDVRVAGMREARFSVKLPAASRMDPWREQPTSTLYRPGSTIAIEALSPVPLKSAAWSLTGTAGQRIARGSLRDDGRSGDRRPDDGIWSDTAAHRVEIEDPRGVWRLTLHGTAQDGRAIETVVRLLIAPPPSTGHPRLYFDARGADAMRARRHTPALTALWTSLETAARSSRESGVIANGGAIFERLDSTYLLPTLLGYFDVLNRARIRIANNSLVGFVDEDRTARESAREALLDVCRWPTWTPPWFEAHGQHTYYPAGQLASAVALGYDLLYDDLSAGERRLVRDALRDRAVLPTWREYVLDNRVMANTSNWIAHTVGGAIIAAAAIVGDGSEEEESALVPPLNGLLMKIEDHMAASFLDDGSYGEGISYQEFDLETLGPMLWAVERVLGQSYWTDTAVRSSLSYPLHTLADPISESFDMGDSHPPTGHAIAPIVARSTDPVTRWYASRFDRRTILDFLFFDDSVAPKPPSGTGSRVFRDKGNAVFRSGWDRDAGLVLFRAGPTFNHNHADQGSFQFRAFGETLVTEAGWSDYYKDPYYDTFFTQAAGHNTLLVDANPASQEIADTAQFRALDRRPRITDHTLSDFYDAVGSDLTPVYRERLERYTRRLVYLVPDCLLVFDRARASGAPAEFTWRLHVPSREGVTMQGAAPQQTATYVGSHAAMIVRPFASVETDLTLHDGHIPYPVFAASTPAAVPSQPAYFDLATVRSAADVWFLVALIAAKSAEAANAAAAQLSPVEAPGWTGIVMPRGGKREMAMFSIGEASRQSIWDGWRTDAESWTATMSDRAVSRFGAQRVREVLHDGRVLIGTNAPIDVALQYGATVTGVIEADRAARVRVRVSRAPDRITVNGATVSAPFDPAGGLVTLDVAAGSSAIVISQGGAR